MGWQKNDDRRHQNGKLLRAGLAADGLHERMSTYSAANETDGFVPDVMLPGLGVDKGWERALAALARECLIERDDDRNGWIVHDYLNYNPSHAELQAKREQDRRRKDSARSPSRFRTESPQTLAGFDADSEDPDPTRPVSVSTDVETQDRRRGAHLLPDDFALTAEMRFWASANAPLVDTAHETKRFEAWARSRGKRYVLWNKTWENWMLRVQGEKADRAQASTRRNPNETRDRINARAAERAQQASEITPMPAIGTR